MLPQFFHYGQNWHIETRFAISALAKHANNLRAMELGASIVDLFLEAKRDSERVDYVSVEGGKVAIIPLNGVMMLENQLCNAGIQTVSRMIREADANPEVIGTMVEASTGGGESIAGQELFNAVLEAKKPIIFYTHFLASAGVMGSLAADGIYAAGSQTEVGSVGVMATVENGLVEFYKKNFTQYYAETSENKNEEMRGVLNGDPSKLIEALNKADARFMADVKKYRPLAGEPKTIKETLSGRMFFADEATKRGLIDGIKTKTEVIDRIQQLAVQYKKSGKPKKGKKMASIFKDSWVGKLLNLNDESEKTDEAVVTELQAKFEAVEGNLKTANETAEANKIALETANKSLESAQARVAELEATNLKLAEKVGEVNEANQALTAQVEKLEGEKVSLSKQLSALTLSTTAPKIDGNEITDSEKIEKSARKAFGGEIEIKK